MAPDIPAILTPNGDEPVTFAYNPYSLTVQEEKLGTGMTPREYLEHKRRKGAIIPYNPDN